MGKPILRVVHPNQPEVERTCDDLYEEQLKDCIRVETRAQVEIALKKPEMYRGVFLETLRVRTGNTRASAHLLYNMGNGIDIIQMAKEKGLPVVVISEAARATDPEIMKLIEPYADAIFEMGDTDPDEVLKAMRKYFV